jgi:hypothetical protein
MEINNNTVETTLCIVNYIEHSINIPIEQLSMHNATG